MIIEFFGFPGSGKTTICNKFVKKINKNKNKVIRGTFDHLGLIKRSVYKLFYSTLCLFISPSFYFKNIQFFFKISVKRKIMIGDFLNMTYLYSRYSILKHSKKIIVFDQGLIQAYWSILVFAEDGENYDYQHLFKNLDTVVILEMDQKQNVERLFSRKDQRSRVQKQFENIEFYFNKFLTVKKIIEELDFLNKLYLNSEKKPKKNAKRIKKNIKYA